MGMYQMSVDLRNVDYHACVQCITKMNAHFNAESTLKIGHVRSKLTKVHFAYLLNEFGVISQSVKSSNSEHVLDYQVYQALWFCIFSILYKKCA